MSSLFNIAAGGQAGFYDYQINDSLRFEDGSSPYLNRTPASAGNRNTWTWSAWVKRGNISGSDHFPLFGAHLNGSNNEYFYFRYTGDEGELFWRQEVSATAVGVQNSLATFRDPSAWYHIVFVYDSSNATSTDRIKIYVNGVRLDLDNANSTELNRESQVNNTVAQYIGYSAKTASYFDGYLAEINFIDGQALDPTSFGETKSGVWIPKDTSGLTFGTNGFRLEFGDSAAIGDDTSGNGNDFTANNLSAHDVVPDSPTVNYATLNAVDNPALTLSEGNLKFFNNATAHRSARGTFGMASGKWYFECCVSSISNIQSFGLSRQNVPIPAVYTSNVFVLLLGFASPNSLVYIYNDGTVSSGVPRAVSVNDILKLAYDADSGKLWLGINDDYFDSSANVDASANPATGTNPTLTLSEDEPLVPYVNLYANSGTYNVINFGADGTFLGNITSGNNSDENGYGDFKYAVPSGFLALNSANLPEPSITPLDDDLPEDYFDTVLYTGNGSSGHVIDGIQTNPDFTWIKDRNVAKAHMLFDSLRGDGTNLYPLSSDSTGAERTDLSRLILGDGQFEIDVTESSVNANNQSYVAWNWQAGGTAVSNTDGSITSSVSANTEAGFSIVTYTDAGASTSYGHGLSQKPDIIFTKQRNGANDWLVFTDIIDGSSDFLRLNTTAASATSSASYDASTVSVSLVNTGTYVSYCFHSVEGYSKIGVYEGNNSTDGTFVYTGFRPAWVMIKNIDTTVHHWIIMDNKRNISNVVTESLYASNPTGTQTGTDTDFVSNGFKIRNAGGLTNDPNTYIYMAFAEMPFKYANAR